MNQEIANNYSIAIQQKRVWKYLAESNLPELSKFEVHITGAIDEALLKRAIRNCIKGNEIFSQVYKQPKGFSFPVTQVSPAGSDFLFKKTSDAADERYEKAMAEYRSGCPLSVFLMESDTEGYTLEAYLPALTFDKASCRIFFDNLCREYFEEGSTSNLIGEGPIQYIDFSEWQNGVVEEEAAQGKAYWNKAMLAEAPLSLPYALAAKPPRPSYKRETIAAGRELTLAIKAFAKSNQADAGHFLLAAYVLQLQKLCAAEDIIVGINTNGRASDEVTGLYGMLSQVLPFIHNSGLAAGFAGLMKAVSAGLANTHKWQLFYEPDQFAQHKQINRDYLPFLFDYEEVVASRTNGQTTFTQGQDFTQYHDYGVSLSFTMDTASDALTIDFRYDANRYSSGYIGNFAAQFIAIASQVALGNITQLGAISVISNDEARSVLNVFNHAEEDFADSNSTLHALFEKQAKLTPGNIAIRDVSGELTYQQLDELSNTLAEHLIKSGIQKGEIVGLFTERSAQFVIGLLGILKAGGAYLPIAAAYPAERIELMLEATEARMIVMQEKLLGKLPAGNQCTHIYLDTNEALQAGTPRLSQAVAVEPADIAYVIFTSGSTGKPKACLVMHYNIVNYILAIAKQVLYDEAVGNFPVFTSVSFDATLTVLFGSLMSGKALFIFDEHLEIDKVLAQCFSDSYNIDAIKLTPSHILILDSLPVCSANIKFVMSGGEALSKKHVEIIRKKAPNARIVNHYGPTETTVGCLTNELLPGEPKLYVGKPILNSTAYIVDAANNLMPVGIPGEILIGGRSVSAGYLNAASLTDEKFIANPFGSGKLYKTGDLGYWHPDGNIEYLGRKDNQVKIRGNRVEPGEAQECINTMPGIEKSVVLADKDGNGNNILVAFYNAPAIISWHDFVQFLSARLPDYMVPSYFVKVPQFPVNHNGKLDTKELLKINYRSQQAGERVAPQNATQETLAGIFKEVLALDAVGIHDNFFELGGHSLLAMQLISRIREAFEMEVQIRALFKYPTIEGLQQHIDSGKNVKSSLPGFVKVLAGADIPMSYAQRRMWFLAQLAPDSTMYNMPGVLKLTGNYSIPALKASFDYLAGRHEILRTVFKSSNEQLLQVILPQVPANYFAVDDLSAYSAQEAAAQLEAIIKSEYARIFNLEQGPLFIARVVKMDDGLGYLFINMHHIITDEWSVRVLVEELTVCYNAYVKNSAPQLPAVEFTYADFAVWQAEFLKSEGPRQLSFWKQKLEGANPFLDLPFAKARVIKDKQAANVLPFKINKTLSDKIRAIGRGENASLFMALYSAFAVLLHKYTGSNNLLIGTPVANRNYKEIERQLGFFVNTIVLRAQFDATASFKGVLRNTLEEAMDAFANQDFPFEKIVEELSPERKQGYSPLFQVYFVLHNSGGQKLGFDGVTIEDASVNEREAKFDIVFSVEDKEELGGYLEYNADLFEVADMERFNTHFENILKQVTDNPDIALSDISLLSASERKAILDASYNKVDYPADSVMAMVGRNAALRPSSVAIVHNGVPFTYSQLSEESNALAAVVAAKVKPGSIVAVCMDKSPGMFACFLGIMKAGAAYLAISPQLSAEEKAFLLRDSSTCLIIADKENERAYPGVELISYPISASAVATAAPAIAYAPQSAAYVIYTSGTTGQPKGVSIHHQALQNLVQWGNNTYGINEGDKFASLASVSSYASMWEAWVALCAGAELHIINSEILSGPVALQTEVIAKGITHCSWGLVLAEQMLALQWPGNAALRQVWLSGGKLRHLPSQPLPFKVTNNYGAAEAGLVSTGGKVASTAQAMTVGKPIANTCMLVLDKDMQLVPNGVWGELYVGGDGLALHGYFNGGEASATNFAINPFSEIPVNKLWRTGDIACYAAEGEVRVYGRKGGQVKIRGYSVAPHEVEVAVLAMPSVNTCAVIVKEGSDGHNSLALFVAMAQTTQELRQALQSKLPAYMQPSAIVKVSALPVTINGSIDYKALAGMDINHAAEAEPLPEAATPQEGKLGAIWEELLGVKNIKPTDDFFELGGHSLLITMLKSRIYEVYGKSLPVKFFFEYTTLGAMAAAVAQYVPPAENAGEGANTIKKAARQKYKL